MIHELHAIKKQNPSRYTPGISFSLQSTKMGTRGAHSASSGGATSWKEMGGQQSNR